MPQKFEDIKNNISKIKTYSQSISDFLESNPGEYSHFVLLDHQDWMAYHSPEKLLEEWNLIIQNSRPGTKILFRSASFDRGFLPKTVIKRLNFNDEETEALHKLDRVGTYGSLHLAEII